MSDFYEINFLKQKIDEFQKGNKEKAFLELKKFVEKNNSNSITNYNLGLMAQELNKIQDAKKYYQDSIKINKSNWQAKFNFYLILIKEKKYKDALLLINSVLSIQKNYQPALRDKALVLNHLNNPAEALSYIQESIKLNNNDYIAINILGLIYKKLDKFDLAVSSFQKAINVNKDYLPSYNNLSTCFSIKHDFKTSENILLKAFKIDSDAFETINNLANIYSQTGKYDKAITYYNKALIKTDEKSNILYNIGVAYFYKKDFISAESYYKKSYKINPSNDVLKKNYALLLLAQQKYSKAWSFYDGRLNLNDFLFKNSTLNNVKNKLWKNKKINKNDKILVIKEQGIGDEILFSSMYPELLKNYPNSTIETEPRLLDLFVNSFSKNKNFVEFGKYSKNKKELKKFDHIIYSGSLGKLFRTKQNEFPKNHFLIASELNQELNIFLNKFKNKTKIGISWKSKAIIGSDKSLDLETLKPILNNQNLCFFNLQYYESLEEINNLVKNNPLIEINNLEGVDLFNDFKTVASFLKKLDLFITVSNSTAHLAAALGVKTWIIKPKNHAVLHYWNQPSNTTPWYPSVKLYDFQNNWSKTIENINKDLKKIYN